MISILKLFYDTYIIKKGYLVNKKRVLKRKTCNKKRVLKRQKNPVFMRLCGTPKTYILLSYIILKTKYIKH